ncbi:signal transduction histidine kinase [Paucibacter oligotrophus]|uniref:histidine kinase n=1 Tax=Roseateles oligotrophus TaxID=1769250 RepID=A0A840LAA3_9BURK|nr:ATP-binding protein [Roseateles oligotrophus]MBB4843592.1 signal transduction histidine kinase [Roseateles oligotrophus]
MNSVSDARNTLHPKSRRLAGPVFWLALLLLLPGLSGLLLLLLKDGSSGLAALLLGLWSVLLLLGVVGGLGWRLGQGLTRQRFGESLQNLQQQNQRVQHLLELQPDWQWRSNAQHRLLQWRGPAQASTHTPAHLTIGPAAAGASLWERFKLAEPQGGDGAGAAARLDLQQLLQQQLPELACQVCPHEAPEQRWLLQGLACLDGQGRFQGYQGLARPLEPVQRPVEPAAPAWLEALPGPAWLLDAQAQSPLLALNRKAAELCEAGTLLGTPWSQCLNQLATVMPSALHQALAEQPPQHFEDGARRLALVSLSPNARLEARALQSSMAATAQVVGLATEQAAAQALMAAQLKAQMELQANEAHEQASFSYTVSHDLRAPLRVVEGFARILKEDYGRLLDRIGNDHLDRVMGAASRMNSMIDSLLSLTQLSSQPLARQPVNLSQMAEFVIEELGRAAPERRVAVFVQPQMVVQGDPTLLRMVLENLLGNAWKYSGKCAQAEIRFELQPDKAGGAQPVFCISDNGAGFDMRFADRLFGVFQRLHSASDFQGTGVGLASVRRIVRRHGGDIWAEAEVGAGARFYFTLAA